MSTRRRNHFIPRFLLNRFASRSASQKHWLWQLGVNATPKEISTRDAAVQTDFYGGPVTGVEDAFAIMEGTLHHVLLQLDRGASPDQYADELRTLVWTLAIRTLALRKQFAETASTLIQHFVESAGSDRAHAALFEYFSDHFDDLMDEQLSKLPIIRRLAFRALFMLPFVRQRIFHWARERLQSFDLRAFMVELQSHLSDNNVYAKSAQTGHVRGISRLLTENRIPDSFAPARWEVAFVEPHSVILGDACALAVSHDGKIGTILRFSNSWSSLYLPLSHSQVLIARRNSSTEILSTEALNEASARISWAHIFASRLGDRIIGLSKLIGQGSPIIDEEELSSILDESAVWPIARRTSTSMDS